MQIKHILLFLLTTQTTVYGADQSNSNPSPIYEIRTFEGLLKCFSITSFGQMKEAVLIKIGSDAFLSNDTFFDDLQTYIQRNMTEIEPNFTKKCTDGKEDFKTSIMRTIDSTADHISLLADLNCSPATCDIINLPIINLEGFLKKLQNYTDKNPIATGIMSVIANQDLQEADTLDVVLKEKTALIFSENTSDEYIYQKTAGESTYITPNMKLPIFIGSIFFKDLKALTEVLKKSGTKTPVEDIAAIITEPRKDTRKKFTLSKSTKLGLAVLGASIVVTGVYAIAWHKNKGASLPLMKTFFSPVFTKASQLILKKTISDKEDAAIECVTKIINHGAVVI